jgi:hypothetical protein
MVTTNFAVISQSTGSALAKPHHKNSHALKKGRIERPRQNLFYCHGVALAGKIFQG